MDEHQHPDADVPAAERGVESPSASPEPVESAPSESASRRWLIVATVVGGVLVAALLASQVYLITTLDRTNDELAATRADVADLESQLSAVDDSIFTLSQEIASGAPSPTPSQPVVPAGFLPRFEPGQPDLALGLRLGSVTGPDAYTGESRSIDPADGTKRVWMVWAHWCPYCQEELPGLSDLYPSLAQDYPGIELETVTSSIDPSRGNPLEAYLDTEQFPFPVMVDADLSVAGQMGVNAFPFWMVTDGDGTVLLRMTGLLEEARLTGLLDQLSTYGT